MICANFLTGANLDHAQPTQLLSSALHCFKLLPEEQRLEFIDSVKNEWHDPHESGKDALQLSRNEFDEYDGKSLRAMGWRCQACGSIKCLEVHHQQFRSNSGEDTPDQRRFQCSLPKIMV